MVPTPPGGASAAGPPVRPATRTIAIPSAAASGSASRRARTSGSGPSSARPGIRSMIAKMKSTMIAPA